MKTEHLKKALTILAELVEEKGLESIGKIQVNEYNKSFLTISMDRSEFNKAFAGETVSVQEDSMGITYTTSWYYEERPIVKFSSFAFKRTKNSEVTTITLPN